MTASRLTRATAALLVAALTLFAFGLRLRGLDFELPHYAQTDGLPSVDRLRRARAGIPDPRSYGDLTRAYGHLLPELARLIPDRSQPDAQQVRSLEQHAQRHSVHWMDVRLVSVLTSSLLVVGTYSLARRFLSRWGALFAAAFPATSLVHVSISQMERPHGIAATTALFGVLAAVHLRRRGDVASYLLAGVAGGLALGALQSGVAVLLPIGAACFLRRRGPGRAKAWWVLASAALVALFTRWLYPYYFREAASLRAPEGGRLRFTGHGLSLQEFDGTGFGRLGATLLTYDPALLAVLLLGSGLALSSWIRNRKTRLRDRRDLLVVLSYAVPHLAVLGAFSQTYERFTLPLLPYYALLCGFALDRVRAALPARRSWVATLGAACALAFPALTAWHMGSVRTAPDTMEQAAAWIAANVGAGQRVDTMPYVDLPVLYGADSLDENLGHSPRTPWIEYQGQLAPFEFGDPRFEVYLPRKQNRMLDDLGDDPLAYYRSVGTDYVVIQQVGPEFRIRAIKTLRKQLQEGARLVARFSPLKSDSGKSGALDTRYQVPVFKRPFFVHLWMARRMGATLEVYALE